MSTHPELLRIDTSTAGPRRIVRARGELTYDTAARLDDCLRHVQDIAHPHLDLDVNGVVFCDSVGLSVLISATRRAARHHGSVALRGLHGSLRRMVSLTGVGPLFTLDVPDERADLLETAGDRHGEPA